MTKSQLQEEALIDITFAIFQDRREPITFQKIMDEIRSLTGITKKDMELRLPQFYTDLNIDGRFMAMNEGNWALREWYPVDQIEVETAPVVKTRKKKKKASDDEEEEDLENLDVEVFEEDYEELGDEKEVDEEVEADPDEDVVDDPAEGLEIIPDEEMDIDEEDDDEEEEEEDEK